MIKLLPEERLPVRQYVYSICSITLDQTKDYLLEGRLGPVAEQAGCRSLMELVSLARSDPSGLWRRKIVDEITTGETLFFRDLAPFDLLRQKLVPDLLAARAAAASPVPIRIWSAACSAGQEIYSIAMVLAETLTDRTPVRLLGTDVSDHALSRASTGIYTALEVSRGLPDAARSRHFLPHGKDWKIRDELRSWASFRRLNLMEDFTALGKFDIIFCRNVAIYFSEADRISLYRRLAERLDPGGALIIGALESLSGPCTQFVSQRYLRAVYYTVAPGSRPSSDPLSSGAIK